MAKNRSLRKGEGEHFYQLMLCVFITTTEFVLYIMQDDEARTPRSQDLAKGIYAEPQE